MLRLLQRRRTQQQAATAPGPRPAPRGFAVFGVPPDPADVGLQRFGQLIDTRLELGRVVKENKVQPPQALPL
jgi:hypothetical protein